MKHLILLLAALLPALAFAAEKNDTTFTVKDKKIVVDVDSGKTVVKVYNKDGYQLSKTREMEFVDGQEVERVFVGSPLIPSENLQNMSFRPHFPMVWFGMNFLTKGVSSNSSDGLHSRRTGSFELGITPYSMFNKARTFGLTVAVQLAWVHQCFRRNYAMYNDGGRIAYTKLGGDAGGNNINYGALRIPVMLSLQRDYEDLHMALGLSAGILVVSENRSRRARTCALHQRQEQAEINRILINDVTSWHPTSYKRPCFELRIDNGELIIVICLVGRQP